jgi:OOP family OmpA-OmpF porin
MKPILRMTWLAVATLPVMMLAACGTQHVPQMNKVEMNGENFNGNLARDYKVLSNWEAYEEMNWTDAVTYADKSMAAAAGKSVAPDNLTHRDIQGAKMAELQSAHTRLTYALANGAAQRAPVNAARAQSNFDCWAEQQEEGWQIAQIAACKDGFWNAMLATETAMAPQPAQPPVAQAPAPQPAPAPVAMACDQNPNGTDKYGKLCQEGVVYFGFDRYDLLGRGESDISKQTANEQIAALDLIVRQAISANAVRLDVYGRTDSSGPVNYNYGLSDCRARTVVDGLKARGLPRNIDFRIIPLGQSSLVQQTGDNVRYDVNRVVKVAFQTNRNAPLAQQPMPAPKVDLFGCGTAQHPFPPRMLTTTATR